jgi:thioredoxin reductase (NADPH)
MGYIFDAQENKMKDLVIIGAGPAGLTAAIYGMRAGLDLSVIEKFAPGGQVVNTWEVENYPGFKEPLAGWELMAAMEDQTRRLGADIASADVTSIKKEGGAFTVELNGEDPVQARAVIIAAGASFRKLGIPGEKEFTGRGVSYCATCDGAFYKERVTAVIGGGDTALEEAIFLTRFASKVYLVHRRDEFRAGKILVDRVLANPKIVPVYNALPKSINGTEKVLSLTVTDKNTGKENDIVTDGVFIFVGFDPNTGFLDPALLNESREVIVDLDMKTSIPGLFAAGDLRSSSIRQIVSACGDGATAAQRAYHYITSL